MSWYMLLAQTAGDAVTTVSETDGGSWWKNVGIFLMGVIAAKIAGWLAAWSEGKGKAWVDEKITMLQGKINENSVLSQIAADDAVMKIMREALPEVITEIGATAQKDLKDGKFDKVDWDGIGKRLWEKTKPIIVAGKNDYLEQSSFEDGKAVARMIAQKFFKTKDAEEKGLTK